MYTIGQNCTLWKIVSDNDSPVMVLTVLDFRILTNEPKTLMLQVIGSPSLNSSDLTLPQSSPERI